MSCSPKDILLELNPNRENIIFDENSTVWNCGLTPKYDYSHQWLTVKLIKESKTQRKNNSRSNSIHPISYIEIEKELES